MVVLMKSFLRTVLWGVVLSSTLVARAGAQEASADSDDLNVIELELESSTPAPADSGDQSNSRMSPQDGAEPPKSMEFSDLGQLAPFSEVSVLQKRFLPKTGRFQLFGGLSMVTNDPFFNVIGAVAKGGYFFNETWGIEASYFGLSTSEAKATKELKEIQGVETDNLIVTKSVLAVDVVMVPVYGKMTWLNEAIIPFDLYFSVGAGTTKTQSEDAGTLHLAAGQIFALSKSTAFRWDFSWNFFNATGVDGKQGAYNNLFLTAGWSWFFPEAKYR